MLIPIILSLSLIVLLLIAIFFFWTLIHCIISGLSIKEKLVWIVAMFVFPLISNLIYLLFINKGDKMKDNKIKLGKEKIFAGVCSGLANHFKIDPFYVRIITVLLLFVSFGTVLIAYLILWIIMPQALDKQKKVVKK